VLNLDQPDANWEELGKKLQRRLSTVTIPVLLLKSSAGWSLEIEGLRDGAAGVIHRPLNPAEFLARLDDALKQVV
jgi:DNA-binding response OmpR family regulator